MLKKFIATIAFVLAGSSAFAATYDPVGVQNDVATSTVFGGGWTTIYQDLFNQTPAVAIGNLFVGANTKIMLAAKQVGSSTFDVLAWMDASTFIAMNTATNATVSANGALWYKNRYSMGFAGIGDTIAQSSADVNGTGERDRLSWHTNGTTSGATELQYGWRSGNNTNLNNASNWERYVLTNTPAPVPLPAGLPLLLAALSGLGVLRMRGKTA